MDMLLHNLIECCWV